MYLVRFHTIIFIILLSFSASADRGLMIKGNYYPMEQRTSVNISGLPKILNTKVKSKLVTNFDFKVSEHLSSGDMFRIKFRNPNYTLTLNHRVIGNNVLEFRLNIEGQRNLAVITLNKDAIGYNWLHTQISLDVVNNQLIWQLQDKQLVAKIDLTKGFEASDITLGKDGYYVDVADFYVRNMNIKRDDKSILIPFDESKDNILHANDGSKVGSLTNPNWLINQSYYWKKTGQTSLAEIGGIQFDEKNGRFIIYCKDYLEFYDIASKKFVRRKFKRKFPLTMLLGTSYIANNKLVIYEVNNLPNGTPNVVTIDLNTLDFSVNSDHQLPMQLHHHIGFINKENDYVLFGGFGNDRYSNTFVRFSAKKSQWDTLAIKGDRISPRYFTSGYYNKVANKAYIFGGMGNDEGDKTLGREYFYDFYEVDLNSRVSKKLWQLKWKDRDLVPTRNLVRTDEHGFYVLMYPEYVPKSQLQLYRFSLNTPKIEKLGSLIPIKSGKIKTSANLFFDEQQNSFYAVTQVYDEAETSSQLSIFELKAPPVGLAQLDQYNSNTSPKWMYIIVGALLLGGSIVLIRYFKKKSNQQEALKEDDLVTSETDLGDHYDFPKQNAVFLFGTFKVYDNKGREISHLFSNRLRQLFVFFLLHEKNSGITSAEISKNFWPDKSLSESKNIRGVSINQLRKILSGLHGVELKFDHHYYELVLGDTYVDYYRFKTLSAKENTLLPELSGIISNGNFLESLKGEMFDDAKQAVEIVEAKLLYEAMSTAFIQKKFTLITHLAKKSYQIDPFNAETLKFELKAWQKMGNQQQAKVAYDRFCERYLLLMGEKFTTRFADIISS